MKNHSPETKFESLLDFLRRTRGFDFSGYKRGSLTRRITRRMQMIGLGESRIIWIFWKCTRRSLPCSSIRS